MKEIPKALTGENLKRFLNIQETIRQTRQNLELGGPSSQRTSHEDILKFPVDKKHIERSITLSLSSPSGYTLIPSEDFRERQKQRKGEFGFGYRDLRDDQSDWMFDELKCTTKGVKNKLSIASEAPCKVRAGQIQSLDENKLETPELGDHDGEEVNMRLYDQITPEEEHIIYENVCHRYGKESGRRYLLVRSMTAPDKQIEGCTTTERKSTEAETFTKRLVECRKNENKHKGNVVCPEISEDVTKKMKTLVDITPFCSTERIRGPKRWKDVLRSSEESHKKMLHASVKGESDSTILTSDDLEYKPCCCGSLRCDCDLIKVNCDVPKIGKKCDTMNYEVDETNNYLITCRENFQDNQNNDRRVTVLQQHTMNAASRVTSESIFLKSTHDKAENQLLTCLTKVMPPQGQEVSGTVLTNVQQVANVIAKQKMINEHEWRVWRYTHAKMEHIDNSDELDSLDSDIISSSTSDDELSEYNIKFSKGIHPSRIPYFKETFELANTLFEKIGAKMEKIISKNHNKKTMGTRKPYSRLLQERFKLLRNDNRLFDQIFKQMNSDDLYCKKLTSFSERKRRKRVRANQKKMELRRKQNRRKFIEGMQLGKKYRRPRRSFLYTEQENYRGFNLRRQKFLRTPGMEKYKKCNMDGKDLSEGKLTQKVIHDDYRLIRRLFDGQLKRNKKSLWDPGMKARLEEYLGTFKEVNKPTEEHEEEAEEYASDVSVVKNQRRPKKDEQKTQTALPNCWSYCSRSSGNGPEAFTSIIRSLTSNARSHAVLPSGNHGNLSKFQSSRSQSTIGQTTVRSSSFDPVSKWPTKVQRTSDIGHSRHGKPRQVPSFQAHPLKGHSDIPGTPSFGLSETDSSVPQISHLKRLIPRRISLSKSNKSFRPMPNGDPPRKNLWKPSKTVR